MAQPKQMTSWTGYLPTWFYSLPQPSQHISQKSYTVVEVRGTSTRANEHSHVFPKQTIRRRRHKGEHAHPWRAGGPSRSGSDHAAPHPTSASAMPPYMTARTTYEGRIFISSSRRPADAMTRWSWNRSIVLSHEVLLDISRLRTFSLGG